jgi:hypothetical protein
MPDSVPRPGPTPTLPAPRAPAGRRRAPGAVRAVLVAVVVLALLAIAYVGAWFHLALQFRDGLLEWAEARRAEGLAVRHGTITLGGFPFLLRATVEQPALAAPDPKDGSWQGEVAIVEAEPWRLDRLRVRSPGAHTVAFGRDGRTETYRGRVRELTADMTFARGQATQADVRVAGLHLSGGRPPEEVSLANGRLRIERPSNGAADHTTATLEADLDAEDLRLPNPRVAPLGRDLARLRFSGSVLGPIPPGPLRPALMRWRDAGGTVKVARLETRYGPLAIGADGTAALDGAMQPIGAFTARIEGFIETIDALRERGLVRGRDALTAKIVLGALARRSGDGPPALTIAVTMQDGKLYVGPVALMDMPQIPW